MWHLSSLSKVKSYVTHFYTSAEHKAQSIASTVNNDVNSVVHWTAHEVDKITDAPKQLFQAVERSTSNLSLPLVVGGVAALALVMSNGKR